MSETASFHQEWLNRSFIEKVIRRYTEDDDVEVNSFAIESGSKPGENFASELLRASINYSLTKSKSVVKSISVIVKVMPMVEEDEHIDIKQLFRTEMKMYGETLIAINRLLLNAYDNPIKLFPR